MKQILILVFSLFCLQSFGQNNIKKTAGVPYTNGVPTFTPNTASGAEIAIDTATSKLYWWSRNASTWVLHHQGIDVISGSIAPAYTPRDNQSNFAINADNELYYYTGASWVQINAGSDGNGIYSGSGTTGAKFTSVTVDSILRFQASQAYGRVIVAVAGGTDVSGVTVADTFSRSYYDDPGGTNLVEANNEGISLTTISSDRVTITGADTRYAADYSGTYSARSLVDKAYVDGLVSGGVSIPDAEVAFGNATSDGITSASTFTYDGDILAVGGVEIEGSTETVTAKEGVFQDAGASGSGAGGNVYVASYDGAAQASGDRLGGILFNGQTGVSGTAAGATIEAFAEGAWSGTTSRSNLRFATANTGSTTPTERLRITRSGVVELRNGANLDFYTAADVQAFEWDVTDSVLYVFGYNSGSEISIQGKFSLIEGSIGLSGNVNNVYLPGDCGVLNIGSTGAYSISGIQPSAASGKDRILFVYNSSSFDITLLDESASSTATNRFALPDGNVVVGPDEMVAMVYADGVERWKVLFGGGGTSGLTTETNAPPVLYPSQITATQNDYSPTGYSTTVSQVIQVDGDGSFRTITGLSAATRNGVEKTFDNDGTNCYIVAKQHTGSSAANRFDIPKDVIMYPGMQATFRYDSVGQRWRLKSTNKEDVYYTNVVDGSIRRNTGSATTGDSDFSTMSASGGSASYTAPTSTIGNRYFTLSTSTAATAFPYIAGKNQYVFLSANETYIRVSAKVRTGSTLSTNAENYQIRLAIEQLPDTTISEGAYINYDNNVNSGGWTVITHNGSAPNTTNAGSAIATSTNYILELIYYPYGEVVAFINGTRYATTSNLPTDIACVSYIMIDKDNGATARTLDVLDFEITSVFVSE